MVVQTNTKMCTIFKLSVTMKKILVFHVSGSSLPQAMGSLHVTDLVVPLNV